MAWQSIESAPRCGRWFLVIHPMTLISTQRGPRAVPEMKIIRRERSSPDSNGYWVSSWGNSVADNHLGRFALWAELDELPLASMYEAVEAQRRAHGGRDFPLPLPLAQ